MPDLRDLAAAIRRDLNVDVDPRKLVPGAIARFGRKGACYCKVFPDGIGAVYADFRDPDGVKFKWRAHHGLAETLEGRRQIEQQRRERAEENARRHEAAAEKAERILRLAPLADRHPYTDRKQVFPYGLRVQHANAAEVRGQFYSTNQHGELRPLAGLLLLIGLRDPQHRLLGLQAIDADGSKSFQRGARVAGCAHLIGRDRMRQTRSIGVFEGVATGLTVFERTGEPIACALSACNLMAVARSIRARLPTAAITIYGDSDPVGLKCARAAAQAVGGTIEVPPFSEAQLLAGSSDWNDFWHATEAVQS